MIDNFKAIDSFLFNYHTLNESEFYFLQIIKRRKDNPELKSDNVLVKPYFISELWRLTYLKTEIAELCRATNSRAMIHLTPRCYKNVAYRCMEDVAKQCLNNAHKAVRSSYLSACGKYRSPSAKKLWFIDLDSLDTTEIDVVKAWKPWLISLPTPNGCHLIYEPYDTRLTPEGLQLDKNNPVLLFADLKQPTPEAGQKDGEG